MRYLITIILGLVITSGHCCDCSSKSRLPFKKADYKDSELIYLVEVGQEIDSGIFEVKLIESYKGVFSRETKIINSNEDYCSYHIKTGEKWLVYTNGTNLTTIDVCSRSRNIETQKYLVPPPPRLDGPSKVLRKKRESEYRKYSKSDKGYIEDELRQLRNLKLNNR